MSAALELSQKRVNPIIGVSLWISLLPGGGGASVNDGINPDEFTLHYISVDQVIRMVSQFGKGALMAKFDVEAAYRNIAVHPADRYLLGMKWRGQYYVDLAVPFGLRSAPYIFNTVAEAVEWILVNSYKVTDLLHYLDDFVTAGPPNSPQCAQNLSTSLAVCKRLGLPLHPGKVRGAYSFTNRAGHRVGFPCPSCSPSC